MCECKKEVVISCVYLKQSQMNPVAFTIAALHMHSFGMATPWMTLEFQDGDGRSEVLCDTEPVTPWDLQTRCSLQFGVWSKKDAIISDMPEY